MNALFRVLSLHIDVYISSYFTEKMQTNLVFFDFYVHFREACNELMIDFLLLCTEYVMNDIDERNVKRPIASRLGFIKATR